MERAGREQREAPGLETETMRDWKVRGALWVSRLSAEHEADMVRKKMYTKWMIEGVEGRVGSEEVRK